VIDAGRYGPAHRRLRREVAATIATGVPVSCARCGLPILPGAPFDLDHADDNSGRYLGASHPDCNRATSRRETYEDDPANGVYWGPPTHPGDPPRRWSRHWYDWRPGQPSYDEG
jgi:hypothetical protein